MTAALKPFSGPFGRPEARLLLSRTCLGCSSADIDLAIELGLEATIAKLVAGDFGARVSAASLARLQQLSPNSFEELRAGLIYRALVGGDALRSTMTLLLHDHFATAFRKVRSIPFMTAHLELIREHALGDFPALLLKMADDPAMLIWLDGSGSTKARPNENFARELFELFSLGHGHYSESDIKAAARVFSGRRVDAAGTRFLPADHDDGLKTAFGKNFKTEAELIEIVVAEPACARFVAEKIGRHFLSAALNDETAETLGKALRAHHFQLGPFLTEVLHSDLMYSKAAAETRIRSPLEFVIGSLRALELRGNSEALAAMASTMGQSLADPPSVAGWPEGRAWISTATIIARQRFAIEVSKGAKSELKLRQRKAAAEDLNGICEAVLGRTIAAAPDLDANFFERAAWVLSHPEAQLI